MDPPIDDPLEITRHRVAASVAAVLAAGLSVWALSRAADLGALDGIHDLWGGLLVVASLAAGRGVFRSVLSRLDARQLAPWDGGRLSRGQLVADACLGIVVAVGFLSAAASGDPWLALAAVAWSLLAADQYRLCRDASRSRPEAP